MSVYSYSRVLGKDGLCYYARESAVSWVFNLRFSYSVLLSSPARAITFPQRSPCQVLPDPDALG